MVSFDVSVSYVEYPTYNEYVQVKDQLGPPLLSYFYGTENVTYEMIKSSISGVSIYFKELKYTKISESPSITWVDLVVSIGSTMGLFLGLCLMVFVEIIELFIELMVILLKRTLSCKK